MLINIIHNRTDQIVGDGYQRGGLFLNGVFQFHEKLDHKTGNHQLLVLGALVLGIEGPLKEVSEDPEGVRRIMDHLNLPAEVKAVFPGRKTPDDLL